MARKNIFQLVEESYNIQDEIKKINKLFLEDKYFYLGEIDITLKRLIEMHLFNEWKYRGTCLTVEEYFSRTNSTLFVGKMINKENTIINYLEVMENFIKLYFDNSDDLYEEYGIKYYTEFKTIFCDLINTLEKKMGLTIRDYKDRVILYPKNAPLEKVVDLYEDEDIQWELIRYVRENLTLAEKRKSLAFLATNLCIGDDNSEKDEHTEALVNKATNILNNLHIRHNNKNGKWENKIINDIAEEDAISLCDMVFNEMLAIVILRDNKKYEKTYSDFNKKQKAARSKKSGGKNNGQT